MAVCAPGLNVIGRKTFHFLFFSAHNFSLSFNQANYVQANGKKVLTRPTCGSAGVWHLAPAPGTPVSFVGAYRETSLETPAVYNNCETF